jgi:hypothetical protein
MKRMKRTLSIALAMIMALGLLTVSAYAAGGTTGSTTTTEKTQITSFDVNKTLEIEAGSAIPDNTTFTVEVTGEGDSDKNVIAGPTLQDSDKSFSFVFNAKDDTSTGSVTKTHTIDLTKINFETSGIYRYVITEKIPSEDDSTYATYITYDESKYELDLVVEPLTVNGESKCCVTQCVLRKYTKVGETYSTQPTKPQSCTFTNVAKLANATIKKTVPNTTVKPDEAFDFYIWIPAGGEALDFKGGEKITTKYYKADGTTETSYIEVSSVSYVPGTTSVTSEFMKGNGTDTQGNGTKFTLKKGEKLELVGAPQGMIYFVMEDDYTTTEKYEQHYVYTENTVNGMAAIDSSTLKNSSPNEQVAVSSAGVISVVQGTVNTGGSEVEFINNFSTGEPATGVTLDVVPFALILVLAVGGGLIYVANKRREER